MINICLFSGGTGNDRFVQLLKNIPNVSLDIIINGYDDGKSTKEILENMQMECWDHQTLEKTYLILISSKSTNGKILYKIF